MSSGTRIMAKAGKDATIKVSHDVYRKLQMVCGWKGVKIATYASETLEVALAKDIARMKKELSEGNVQEPKE